MIMTSVLLDDLEHMRLGDIAVALPGSTAVMRRYGLDFCCGGDKLLGEAVRSPGVALEQIKTELRRSISRRRANIQKRPRRSSIIF